MPRRPEQLARSQRQERAAMDRVGGRQHAGSGNGRFDKNDGSNRRRDRFNFHVECKGKARDDAKSITLKVADLRDVERNAGVAGKHPAMHVEVGGRLYWVLPDWVMEELLGE